MKDGIFRDVMPDTVPQASTSSSYAAAAAALLFQ
jgi:hypothetical protein